MAASLWKDISQMSHKTAAIINRKETGMAKLVIALNKQMLTIQNCEIISSGDVNIDKCEFKFDSEWDGFVKTAVFYQDKANVQYAVLDTEATCVIPAAAMAREGNMYIGVFGVSSGGKVQTSTVGRIFLRQGAISGDTVSTEPSDDIFMAIIAQYQRILELMRKYEDTASEFTAAMLEQNRILETLSAFDVMEIKDRLDEIEDRMIDYANTAKEIKSREVVLRDVAVKFTDKICRIENEFVTEKALCDVYFDEYSYEIAAKALILPVSHDGYLELISSIDIREELNANILIRRN